MLVFLNFFTQITNFLRKIFISISKFFLVIEVIKASEHDYLSTISELQINSQYAAALMSGRIQLHMV